jgi:uncharacterized protein (DUF342 family)
MGKKYIRLWIRILVCIYGNTVVDQEVMQIKATWKDLSIYCILYVNHGSVVIQTQTYTEVKLYHKYEQNELADKCYWHNMGSIEQGKIALGKYR